MMIKQLTKIKQRLARLDIDALNQIIKYCRDRRNKLSSLAYKQDCAKAWDRAKGWGPRQVIYCASTGVHLGGPLQRGDKLTVHAIQPRKKILWAVVERSGEMVGFPSTQINRYSLQTEPPPDSALPLDRKFAAKLGRVITTALDNVEAT